MKTENFRLIAALAYAAIGWRVFPLHYPRIGLNTQDCSCGDKACGSVGKHPMTPKGLKDASANPDHIRAWWTQWPSANIGIVTGALSGIFVLDVDERDGGVTSLAELQDTYGELPETLEADTGGGGQHIVFAYPPNRILRNTAGKLGAGLDTRGDGGYIVAAPSLHQSGQRYNWRTKPSETELAIIPDWLLALLDPAEKPKPARTDHPQDDAAHHWLGKALAKCNPGNRNDTGCWLAQQLRDNGVSETEAERTILEYQQRVPRGDKAYTEREALATVRSAYATPARQPAKGPATSKPAAKVSAPKVKESAVGSAEELAAHLIEIKAGRYANAPWPWQQFTKLTQALWPGTVTTWVGDPGVGKTFAILDCLQFWHSNGIDAACFFIEKDRKFHTLRLLAQLEREGRYTDLEWVKEPRNADTVDAAMKRHAQTIDTIGKLIYSAPLERVTLDSMLAWITEQCESGKRIIVIDPVTAISTGKDRWNEDREFMIAAQALVTKHGASLILVTHSKKGNRQGQSSGHDTAGGAAYFNFCDTLIWLSRSSMPRDVQYQTAFGPTHGQLPIFFEIHKGRNGRGTGLKVGFEFRELRYIEQGVILAEKKGEVRKPMNPEDLGMKGVKPPRADVVQDPFADEDAA